MGCNYKGVGCVQIAPCVDCEYYVEPRMESTNEALAHQILEGDKKRREYDYTEIEDRLRLKLDTLRDRIPHLTSSQLETMEECISWAIKLIVLFRSRNRPPEAATIPERPTHAKLGPCTTLTPDKSPAAFDGSTGQRDLGVDNGRYG